MTEATADVTPVFVALTGQCDRCGKQAWVEVELLSGSRLVFCAHDYREQEAYLKRAARRIIDHRPHLAALENRRKEAEPTK